MANARCIPVGFSFAPSEIAGLDLLAKKFRLRGRNDVIRRLVWRHRHIPAEIKGRFRRARRALSR